MITEATPILQWLNTNPEWAGVMTFLISCIESVAIIGTIVPGTVMMTALGTLAGAGIIPLWQTLFWAIIGAIVGDGISYWLGYYFKDGIYQVWPFRRHPQMLESGKRFFQKHGGMSVFIGRFVGPVRALIPVIAGIFGVKPLIFTIANVLSAIAWAPVYMLPGILLGAASLELPPDIATHAVISLLLLGLFIIFCLWMIKKILSMVHNQINEFLNKIWHKLKQARYFHVVTQLLKHHDRSKTHGQLLPAFYLIVTLALLIALGFYVGFINPPQNILLNKAFFEFFRSLRNPITDQIMIGFTLFGEKSFIVTIAMTLFIYFLVTKRRHTAFHVLGLTLIAMFFIEVAKHLAHTARPWGILVPPQGYSFPSGHSVLSTTLLMSLSLLLIQVWQLKRRWPLLMMAGSISFIIGLSRIYLGAHWFTDVLGGWLLSGVLLTLIALSYNRNAETHKINGRQLIVVTLIAMIVSWSYLYYRQHDQMQERYTQIDWPTYTISASAWLTHEGEHVPTYRLNRFGLKQELLNIQWIGSLETIKTILLNNGWENPDDSNWVSILQRITDVNSMEHLPLVSPLHLDKKPVLVLIKRPNGNRKIMVLRLWNSNIKVDHARDPLWVGSVAMVPRTYSWLFKKKNNHLIDLTPHTLFNTVPHSLSIKEMTVALSSKDKRPMLLIQFIPLH